MTLGRSAFASFDSRAATLGLALALGLWIGAPAQARPEAVAKTEHVTATLVGERSAVHLGESLQIGLSLQHQPHWHTYWRNPGDSGLPTTLGWKLPPGASAGAIEWPAPVRLPIGPLVNYGYEGDLLLPVRFTAPRDAAPGSTLTITAEASWLVCKDVCIPESATLVMSLPVVDAATAPGATEHSARFAAAAAALPKPLRGWTADLQRAGRDLLLTLSPSAPSTSGPAPDVRAEGTLRELPPVQVFPFAEQLVEPARHEAYRTSDGYAVKLSLADGAVLPARFDGIAVAVGTTGKPGVVPWGNGAPVAAEFSAAVREVAAIQLPPGARALGDPQPANAGAANATTTAGTAVDATRTVGVDRAGADVGLLAALALALAGGMVLNLMPCVFPVLSIKLLGLAQQGGSRSALRAHAAFYSAGVLLTFLFLASLLLGLRAAGSAVGWGFQLQEPGVVFALALLFFALGLNLVGAFEFGNLVPQRLLTLRGEHPAVDAFAAGVLAVLAASPCTAPFMGAALGFALTQPPAAALAVFAALGVGMAAPYAALVLAPGWRHRLPRPGPWMLTLKQALAFPLFATVVWLMWVLGLQAGVDGVGRALLALVAAAFAVWALDAMSRRPAATAARVGRQRAGRLALALGLLTVFAWSWPTAVTEDAPAATAAATAESAWQPYDDAALARHVEAGRPVFVDFTAAWCVSCQVNKRLVLHRDATMAAFARADVSLMRADWTHRDARITAALARLGRNGVPVYVLWRPGREPLLLPEILTTQAVREALATLAPVTPAAALSPVSSFRNP